MTFKIASRVWQTSATTGTGTLSLDASSNPTGYRKFVDAIGNANTCPYVIDDGNGNWEEGIGTVTSGTPDTLARTTVINNSLGTTAKINFSAGTKTVQISPLGSRAWWWNSAPTTDQIGIANSAGGMDPISIAEYFKKLLTTAGDFAVNIAGTVVRQTPTQVAALVQSLFTSITSSGSGTFGGLLDLSGASAGQIKFPATQNASSNANTLDDYEEGTWTPVDSSGASLTFSSVTGCTYTKVGRQVFMTGQLTYPSTANGSSASVGGAPFANAGGAVIGVYICSSPSLGMTFMNNAVTTTTFTVSGTGANGTNTNFSTGVLRFTQTYNAAT